MSSGLVHSNVGTTYATLGGSGMFVFNMDIVKLASALWAGDGAAKYSLKRVVATRLYLTMRCLVSPNSCLTLPGSVGTGLYVPCKRVRHRCSSGRSAKGSSVHTSPLSPEVVCRSLALCRNWGGAIVVSHTGTSVLNIRVGLDV